jgi:hypothetical protein
MLKRVLITIFLLLCSPCLVTANDGFDHVNSPLGSENNSKYIKLRYKSRNVQVFVDAHEWENKTQEEKDLLMKRYQLEMSVCELLDIDLKGKGFYDFRIVVIGPEQKAIRFMTLGYAKPEVMLSFFNGAEAGLAFDGFVNKLSKKKEKFLDLFRKCFAECPQNAPLLPEIEQLVDYLILNQKELSRSVLPKYLQIPEFNKDEGTKSVEEVKNENVLGEKLLIPEQLPKSESVIHDFLLEQNRAYNSVVEKINKGVNPHTIVKEAGNSFVYFNNNALPSSLNIYKFKTKKSVNGNGLNKGGSNPRVYFLYDINMDKWIIIHADYKKYVGPEKPKEVKSLIELLTRRLNEYSLLDLTAKVEAEKVEVVTEKPVNEAQSVEKKNDVNWQNKQSPKLQDPIQDPIQDPNAWIIEAEEILDRVKRGHQLPENLRHPKTSLLFKYFMEDHRLIGDDILWQDFKELPEYLADYFISEAQEESTININSEILARFNEWDKSFDPSDYEEVPRGYLYDIDDVQPFEYDKELDIWKQRLFYVDYLDSFYDKVEKSGYGQGSPESYLVHNEWNNHFVVTKEYQRASFYLPEFDRKIPINSSGESLNIGLWCRAQFHLYNAGFLSVEQMEKLGSIPGFIEGEWVIKGGSKLNPSQRSSLNFELLKKYMEVKSSAPSIDYIMDGIELGRWVSELRAAYGRSELNLLMIRLLEELPGWEWNINIKEVPSNEAPSIDEKNQKLESPDVQEPETKKTEIQEPETKEPEVKDSQTKIPEPKIQEPKISEPEQKPSEVSNKKILDQLNSFMGLAVELGIPVSDRLMTKMSEIGTLSPEGWVQLYNLITSEYVNNNYCALCGSITYMFYSDNFQAPRELWEIVIGIMDNPEMELETKKLLLEAVFSASNNIVPSELISRLSKLMGDSKLIDNWEGEIKKLLNIPNIEELYPSVASVGKGSGNVVDKNTVIDKNIEEKMNQILKSWTERVDGREPIFVDAKIQSFETIKTMFSNGNISLSLLEYLVNNNNNKGSHSLLTGFALMMIKLSNNPDNQLQYISVLEGHFVKDPESVKNILEISSNVKNFGATSVFTPLSEEEVAKVFNLVSKYDEYAASKNPKEAPSRTNKNLYEKKMSDLKEGRPIDQQLGKIRTSIMEYTFKGVSNKPVPNSDKELVDLFWDKAFTDISSGNNAEFSLAVGMLFSYDNILFMEEAKGKPAIGSPELSVYNHVINTIVTYRDIVSSEGLLTQPAILFKNNNRNIEVVRLQMLGAYKTYRSIK